MLLVDLDDFHQRADDFFASGEVGSFETFADLGGKVFEASHDEPQFRSLVGLVAGCRRFLLQAVEPLAGLGEAGFEFGLLQQAVFVCVNQATDAPLNSHDLLIHLVQVDVRFVVGTKSPFKLPLEILRIL